MYHVGLAIGAFVAYLVWPSGASFGFFGGTVTAAVMHNAIEWVER